MNDFTETCFTADKEKPIRCIWILLVSSASREGYELITQPRGCGFCLRHLPGFLAQPFFMKLSEQLCLFYWWDFSRPTAPEGGISTAVSPPSKICRSIQRQRHAGWDLLPELPRVSAHWELERTGSYRATCLHAINTQFHHIMTIFCILLCQIFCIYYTFFIHLGLCPLFSILKFWNGIIFILPFKTVILFYYWFNNNLNNLNTMGFWSQSLNNVVNKPSCNTNVCLPSDASGNTNISTINVKT